MSIDLSGTLQAQQEMTDRIHQARKELLEDTTMGETYLNAILHLRELLPAGSSVRAVINVRNSIDGFQVMYFLRKRSIADDHHWLAWVVHLMRGALHPEFAAFLRPVFDGEPLADPKGA